MALHVAQQVSEFCQKNSFFTQKDKVVVGVSGGSDSLCLLHLLKNFSNKLGLSLTVAHLNHQLRGADSEADEDFVRETAARWHLPIFVERQPVATLAQQHRQSLEETARQIRYAFLWRVAMQVGGNKIAVGHNADDQVETVLMHFLRGTGLAGLRGMLPAMDIEGLRLSYDRPVLSSLRQPAPTLIRPLLETSRTEIEAYCRTHNLSPRQDHSNEDITFFRNRLRHELVPLLETYNPNIRQVLRQTAKVVAADTEILSEHLDKAWRFVVNSESSEKVEFDLPDWLSLPLAMKRSTVRRAVQSLRHSLRDINFKHIENAIGVVEKGNTGAKATLPQGLMLTVSYDTFIIADENEVHVPEPDLPQLATDQVLPLALPGITPLPGTNWQLKAALLTRDAISHRQISQVGSWETYLDADVAGNAAVLRRRRSGDTFSPLGMAGHSKKINEFMINEKIPAAWRDRLPLLVANNQILWICGYRLSEEARLRSTTQRVLYLKFERQQT